MKIINILGINLEGFRTWSEPSSFAFAHQGVHIITGANGSGKTSLFAALAWCLYGVNLFDTVQGDLITLEHLRGKDFKGCRVVVTLNIGKTLYRVARHYKFKGKTFGVAGDGLLIFRKDRNDTAKFSPEHLVTDESYTKDSQKWLIRELVPFELFMQSVLFGQRMKRFFEDSQETKRTVLESLMDLSFIDDAKIKVTAKVEELTTEVNNRREVVANLENQITLLTSKIESETLRASQYTKLMKQQRVNLKAHAESLKSNLSSLTERIAEAEGKLSEMNKTRLADFNLIKTNAKSHLDRLQGMKNTLMYDLDKLKRDIAENKGKITALKTPVKTNCNVCGSKLNAEGVKAAQAKQDSDIAIIEKINMSLEKKWVDDNNGLPALTEQIEEAKTAYDTASLDYSKAFSSATERSSLEAQLTTMRANNETIVNDLKRIKQQFEDAKKPYTPSIDIDATNEKIEQHQLSCTKYSDEITNLSEEMTALNWWLSQFKVGGIKSFMFSTMLDSFNQALANYREAFGIEASFSIDEKKANKPFVGEIIIDNVKLNYFNLSGGQKTKADLLICFAYADLLESTVSFNLQLFDEPTTYMDSESAALFDTIIRLRAKEKAIYSITHEAFVDTSGDGTYVYQVTGGINKPSKFID